LNLKRADIDTAVPNANKAGSALIEERRRRESRITGINSRAAG
jgi:hypothetical protein